jgi:hypothetical protein
MTRNRRKINLRYVAYFSAPEKRHLFPHKPPATHHEFTAKTPPRSIRFSRTPIKKTPVKPKKNGSTGA